MTKFLRASFLFFALFLVAGVGLASADAPDPADTLAYYTLDQNSGTTAGDSTPNNNDGTASNSRIFTSNTGTSGIINSGADFTQGDDEIVVNPINFGSNTFSAGLWARFDSTSSNQWLIMQTSGDDAFWRIVIFNGNIQFDLRDPNGENLYRETTSATPYADNEWHHFAFTFDSNRFRTYINGDEIHDVSAGTLGNMDFTDNLYVGSGGGTVYYTGFIDEVAIFDTALTSSEVEFLYASGSPTEEQQYPFGDAAQNFTISAQDSYTSNALSNFSAVLENSTHSLSFSTTNGTINTEILDNSTSLYNITVSSLEAGGYFSRTYTDYNVSTNLQAGLHQAEITFNATNRVSGVEVTDFTASTSSNGGSASQTALNPQLNVSAGSDFLFLFEKAGWYDATLTSNVSALEQSTRTFEVFDHRANFTVNVGAGSADATNFTIDIYSDEFDFHEQLSTTTGSILANLSHGNYTVWLNDSQFELQNYSLFLNSSQNLTQVELQARTARSFNITFLNESSNTVLDNTTINLQFISEEQAFNASTTNGTYFVELLTPGEYEIIYQAAGSDDVVRSYFTTLTEQSFQELNLYLIDEDVSAFYVARAVDEGGNACQANTVRLLRYYVQPNEYRVVAMSRTDSQGQGVLRVRPNTVDYKLLFTGSCGSYETPPTKLIDASNTYTILTAQSVLESYQAILGVQTSLTFVNSTNSFSYTWSSESELVTEGCLNVVKRERGVRTEVFDQCSTGSTGSVIYSIPAGETNETTYFAAGRLETSTSFSTYTTNTEEVSFVTGLFQLANIAPFIAFILFTALILFFGVNAPSLIIGSVAGLVLLSSFLLLSIPWAVLSSLIILGGVILYRLRTA